VDAEAIGWTGNAMGTGAWAGSAAQWALGSGLWHGGALACGRTGGGKREEGGGGPAVYLRAGGQSQARLGGREISSAG
jgi:hypothetical protein